MATASKNSIFTNVALTPDGLRALCGGHNSLLLLDLETGAVLDRHDEDIESFFFVDMLPDGKRAVSGSFDCSFRLWGLYE